MDKIQTLRNQREALEQELDAILAKANPTGSDLDRGEAINLEIAGIDRQIELLNQRSAERDRQARATITPHEVMTASGSGEGPDGYPAARNGVELWQDKRGNPVQVLTRDANMVDVVQRRGDVDPHNLSLGRAICGVVTGRWAGAEMERRVMSEGVNNLGGFIVPEVLFAGIIDLARARAVLMRAGAKVVPLTSDSMTIARLTGDPTFEVKVENSSFSGSDATFDAIGLYPKTIGQVVTLSRELFDDGINTAQLLDNTLSAGLAVEIDRLGLVGNGGGDGFTGVTNTPGIQTDGAIADWDDVLDAMQKLEEANANMTRVSLVTTPAVLTALRKLKTGDGTNSAEAYVAPPPEVAGMPKYTTTNMTAATSVVGDFSRVLMGVRMSPEIMLTQQAGDVFSKFQVAIRIVARLDFACEYPTHLVKCSG